MNNDPHADQPLFHAGPKPADAAVTLVMIHGRGATAHSILQLFAELKADGVAAVAPQAAGNVWYPRSFLSPLQVNQPYLDSALKRVESIITDLIDIGVSSERIALLGFSQGACLVSEFVARHPRRYAAVMVLTGGLIGPEGTLRNYSGTLSGTPVFLGSGDPDTHVPFERVRKTEAVMKSMGATVRVGHYPGMPHTINEEELSICRAMLVASCGSEEMT